MPKWQSKVQRAPQSIIDYLQSQTGLKGVCPPPSGRTERMSPVTVIHWGEANNPTGACSGTGQAWVDPLCHGLTCDCSSTALRSEVRDWGSENKVQLVSPTASSFVDWVVDCTKVTN